MTGKAAVLPLALLATLACAQVPKGRLDALKRGTNITNWAQRYWGNENWKNPEYVSGERLRGLKKAGLGHVRLPIAWDVTFDPATPDAPKNLPHLDEIVRRINGAGLAVILDFHYASDDKDAWWADDPMRRLQFRRWWTAFARHYAKSDPNRVMFEVMNEPVWGPTRSGWPNDGWLPYRAAWWTEQGELLRLIRQEAPRHTVIVGADAWNGKESLMAMTPYVDRNVVYNFHNYDPMPVTNQGASWVEEMAGLRNVAYPAGTGPVPPSATNPKAQAELDRYLKEGWDARKIRENLAPIAAWGRKHRVPLTCNEFGVLRDVAPHATTVRWIEDTRKALEFHKIGWTNWCYEAGGYGILTGIMSGGAPVALREDPAIWRALGLKPLPAGTRR